MYLVFSACDDRIGIAKVLLTSYDSHAIRVLLHSFKGGNKKLDGSTKLRQGGPTT